MGNVIVDALSGFFVWLWDWIEILAYWVATVLGMTSLICFIATKNSKYSQFTVVLIIIYILIMALGSVM